MCRRLILFICCAILIYVSAATAEIDSASEEQDFQNLDQEIQVLKQEVLELNRDLYILEEELLYPSSTQIAVYVSVDVGDLFDLDSGNLSGGESNDY